MKKRLLQGLFVGVSVSLMLACTASQNDTLTNQASVTSETALPNISQYPQTRTVSQVDYYHGTAVSDPYRWLEGEGEEIKSWVGAQNTLARPYLASLPSREMYKERLTALWDYEKYTTPYMVKDTLFYSYNNGLQNQYVLY
ncbi:MAG: S9 family peptidase, partial [Pseudomonadota bacterium]|nr:S9 family peptidase [Pseudomonadota bacterium]